MAAREFSCLIAASVLHLALPVAAHLLPTALTVRPLIGGRLRPTEIDVDVTAEPFQWPTDAERAAGFAVGVSRRMPYSSNRAEPIPFFPAPDPSADPDAEPIPLPPDAPTSPTGEPPSGPSEYDLPPSAVDTWDGMGWPGGPGSWAILPPDMPASPTARPAPTRSEGRAPVSPTIAGDVINREMQAKDRTLGLDLPAAAAIAGIIGGAVRASDTPGECQASFQVALGGDGRVRSVNVLGYSGGGSADWRQVAAAVEGALKGRTFQMKSAFAKGALVTVRARSAMRMPSGDGGREGLTFTFDPTNIGARPSRQVTTSVSVQAL